MNNKSKKPFILTLLIIFVVSIMIAVLLLFINYRYVTLPQRELNSHEKHVIELSNYFNHFYCKRMVYVGYKEAGYGDYDPFYRNSEKPDKYVYYFYPENEPEMLFTAYCTTSQRGLIPFTRFHYDNLSIVMHDKIQKNCEQSVQSITYSKTLRQDVYLYQQVLKELYNEYGISYKPEDLDFTITVLCDGKPQEMTFSYSEHQENKH